MNNTKDLHEEMDNVLLRMINLMIVNTIFKKETYNNQVLLRKINLVMNNKNALHKEMDKVLLKETNLMMNNTNALHMILMLKSQALRTQNPLQKGVQFTDKANMFSSNSCKLSHSTIPQTTIK